ncbi:hypothetical protein AN1V17_16300 [Vallitalea sediminicola]
MGDVIAKINTNDKNLNKIWLEYAKAYNSGLKKRSKKLMDDVIVYLKSADKNLLELFADYCSEAKYDKNPDLIIQYPLVKEVILPYLIEKSQQKSPIHMRWLYMFMRTDKVFYKLVVNEFGNPFQLLLESYDLNPHDRITIDTIMKGYINDLWYGSHHIPEGVIYEKDYCITLLSDFKDFLERLPIKLKEKYSSEYQYYYNLYTDWYTFKDLNIHMNFVDWCCQHNKKSDFVKSYYY